MRHRDDRPPRGPLSIWLGTLARLIGLDVLQFRRELFWRTINHLNREERRKLSIRIGAILQDGREAQPVSSGGPGAR